MITPRFKVDQTSDSVTVIIYAPFAKMPEIDITITDNQFLFYSSPYYLRLTFKGKLIDSELDKHLVKYEAEQRAFKITCMKQNPGEEFPELDMLTHLLTPSGKTHVDKPQIEEVDDLVENEDGDWFIQQNLSPDDERTLLPDYRYGFAGNSTKVISSLTEELHELFDIKDPDSKSITQRGKERKEDELSKFEDDHYLADLYDEENFLDAIEFIPHFYTITPDEVLLDKYENDDLLKLPRRNYIFTSEEQTASVYMGLIDIIYSWCYNHRITKGENCAESAWNLRKLSSTLSWLDIFTNLEDVVVSCLRRSLCFPLIRHWKLAIQVLKDTEKVLSLGKKQVLKCLLEMQRLLNNEEPHYILNELYITDYCSWIQGVSDTKLLALSTEINQIKPSKSSVELELEELENAAQLVSEEHGNKCEINQVVDNLEALSIIENSMATSFNENELVSQNNSALNYISSSDSDDSSSSEDESDSSSDSSSSSNSSSSNDSTSSDSDSDNENAANPDSRNSIPAKKIVHSENDSSELDSDDDPN